MSSSSSSSTSSSSAATTPVATSATTLSSSLNWNRPLHYVIGVDGRPPSREAFEYLSSLIQKNDRLTMIHIFNQALADNLPHDAKPSSVREYYENRCVSRFSKGNYTFSLINKENGYTTSQTLLRHIQKLKDVDFLVVGYASVHDNKSNTDKLGSVVDMSLREARMPVLLNKVHTAPEVAHFVIGADGSDWAHAGVELANRLIRPGSNDRISVIHIEDPAAQAGSSRRFDSDAVEVKYQEYCKTHPAVTFRRILKSKDQGRGDCLVAQAHEIGATCIIVGVDQVAKLAQGKPDHYIGSVTDRIVFNAACSVIVIQERQATYKK